FSGNPTQHRFAPDHESPVTRLNLELRASPALPQRPAPQPASPPAGDHQYSGRPRTRRDCALHGISPVLATPPAPGPAYAAAPEKRCTDWPGDSLAAAVPQD